MKQVRIGVDVTGIFLMSEIQSGTLTFSSSIFTASVLEGFVKAGLAENITLFAFGWARDALRERFPGVNIVSVGNRLTDKACSMLNRDVYFRMDTQRMLERAVANSNIDVLWNPWTNRVKGEFGKPSVVTIHDMIEYEETNDDAYRDGFDEAVAQADHIITPSQYIKEHLMSRYAFEEDMISVIPNAFVEEDRTQKAILGLPEKYILDVNAYKEHKNAITLIAAFDLIRDQTDCDLVLCGYGKDDEFYGRMLAEIKDRNLSDRVRFYYRIAKPEVEWLYNHAQMLVNPSLSEGFGRTPIEGALHNIPVLTSKATCLYEATLGMLEYVEDPCNPAEYAEKILKILNTGCAYDMRKAREAFLEHYNQEKIAGQYMQTCAEIVERKGGKQ